MVVLCVLVMDFPGNTHTQRTWFKEIFSEFNLPHRLIYLDADEVVEKIRTTRETLSIAESVVRYSDKQLPEGISKSELGTCNHAIKVPGANYEIGIKKMKDAPDYFRQFDAKNGWGKYNDFLPWIERVLAGCKKFPNAKIYTSR